MSPPDAAALEAAEAEAVAPAPVEGPLSPGALRAASRPRPLRVAALGGGTGLPRVLAGLAAGGGGEAPSLEITAVVTTADDGGSSGELRRRYGVPAPGDVRNCLVALADGLNPLAALFQHRFDGEGALAGHTVGNVVLTALAQRLGDFRLAVAEAARLLGSRGRVVPASREPVELVARLEDGREVLGESAIAAAAGRIAEIALERPGVASDDAVAAVLEADVVVLGPGSLYSSVVASGLALGLPEALARTDAVRVLVVNLFTEPGESDGHTAADHVLAVQRHLGDVLDVALVNRAPFPAPVQEYYAAEGARPVRLDRPAFGPLGVVPLCAELIAPGNVARHDPQKLARALLDIARAREEEACRISPA